MNVTKIVCSFRQRAEIMKQEHQVESLSNCSSELQQQTHAQRKEEQDTHNTDLLNLDENKFVYNKKNCL